MVHNVATVIGLALLRFGLCFLWYKVFCQYAIR